MRERERAGGVFYGGTQQQAAGGRQQQHTRKRSSEARGRRERCGEQTFRRRQEQHFKSEALANVVRVTGCGVAVAAVAMPLIPKTLPVPWKKSSPKKKRRNRRAKTIPMMTTAGATVTRGGSGAAVAARTKPAAKKRTRRLKGCRTGRDTARGGNARLVPQMEGR